MTEVVLKKDNMKNGVIYIATGARYIECAKRSAESIRFKNPDVKIALFSDKKNTGLQNLDIFDLKYEISNPHIRSKVDYIQKTPFERTIFLDADTRVICDLNELFMLLDKFDIAIAHDPCRYRYETTTKWREDIPISYPQFNSGVIVYRNNYKTQKLFSDWSTYYKKAKFRKDQVTLRELLWLSNDMRLAVLPPEYNLKLPKYLWVWRKSEAIVKIKHFERYAYLSIWQLIRLQFKPRLMWWASIAYVSLKKRVKHWID